MVIYYTDDETIPTPLGKCPLVVTSKDKKPRYSGTEYSVEPSKVHHAPTKSTYSVWWTLSVVDCTRLRLWHWQIKNCKICTSSLKSISWEEGNFVKRVWVTHGTEQRWEKMRKTYCPKEFRISTQIGITDSLKTMCSIAPGKEILSGLYCTQKRSSHISAIEKNW